MHPLIRADLELRAEAGERHRARCQRDADAFARLRERDPGAPEFVGEEPEPPDPPLTDEDRVFLFMQWAVGGIEPREYIGEGEYVLRDADSVRDELVELRSRWLEVRGADERKPWERLLDERYLAVVQLRS